MPSTVGCECLFDPLPPSAQHGEVSPCFWWALLLVVLKAELAFSFLGHALWGRTIKARLCVHLEWSTRCSCNV